MYPDSVKRIVKNMKGNNEGITIFMQFDIPSFVPFEDVSGYKNNIKHNKNRIILIINVLCFFGFINYCLSNNLTVNIYVKKQK